MKKFSSMVRGASFEALYVAMLVLVAVAASVFYLAWGVNAAAMFIAGVVLGSIHAVTRH